MRPRDLVIYKYYLYNVNLNRIDKVAYQYDYRIYEETNYAFLETEAPWNFHILNKKAVKNKIKEITPLWRILYGP
jgi:hypothetical protein